MAGETYRLVLDYPPSVNHIYRRRGGRVFSDPRVAAFRAAVGADVLKQIGLPLPRIETPVDVTITLHPPNDAKTRDIDNPIKAAFDALTKAGVWKDDSQVKELRVSMKEPMNGGRMYVEVRA